MSPQSFNKTPFPGEGPGWVSRFECAEPQKLNPIILSHLIPHYPPLTIFVEHGANLNQLPLESQKKLLDFARALNATTLKGKPGKDLLKFARTIDRDSLKAMEEAINWQD